MIKRVAPFLALLCVCACLLISCKTTSNISDTPIEGNSSYKVEFKVNERTIAQQVVDNGQAPKVPEMNIPGVRFSGWLNAEGKKVDIATEIINADSTYEAIIYPLLDQHVPFLFMDGNNFLFPNKDLTCEELTSALQSLATSEAKMYFPALPNGETSISPQQLRTILTNFFSNEQVDSAITESQTNITRGQFAVIMCKLLQRGDQEKLKTTDNASIPIDISPKTEEFISLLEASVLHTSEANGLSWTEANTTSKLESGFVNYDGWLYYVQDDGYILTDGNMGKLVFGPDGRYTCGDAELDIIVADVLKQIIAENPDADRLTLLKKAFDYATYSFTYLRKDPYLMGATGWEIADAKKMFQDTRGNCYYFAGAFWALAQGLGYEAEAVSGTCTGTHQPHAWVIIEFDGEEFFFDPQWQNNYHTRDMDDMDMFMIPMDKIWYWTYEWVH